MAVYDTSLVEDENREADFAEILKAGVDPLVKMCQHMVDIWQRASEWDKNVFLTNCGLYLQVCPFARRRRILFANVSTARAGAVRLHKTAADRAAGPD